MERFIYSSDNKRYHTLNYHLKERFGCRVVKASVDAGFSCPNIDGSKGSGGCIFCLNGSGDFANHGISVTEQIALERTRIRKKYPDAKLIAYFQAHTNTYAPLEVLKQKYEEALACEGVCGISIATRPDCIENETAAYLAHLSKKTYLTVELGLQSIYDETAKKINRGYDFDVFKRTYSMLKKLGIRVCVHIIDGLIGENEEMMINTAKVLSSFDPDAVKIHLHHILKGTAAENLYLEGKIVPMQKDDYIRTVARQIEYFSPECVIERVTGDGNKKVLVSPMWSTDKISVLGGIDKYMADNDMMQGRKYLK